jgi:hypothetical protein
MEATVITLVRAALQWLGFIELPAPPAILIEEIEPDDTTPDGQISLGVFLLSRA